MKKLISALTVLFAALSLFCAPDASACSAIIISGKYTADGKPLMLKTRDQGEKNFNTNIKFHQRGPYDFISMGPTPWVVAQKIRSTGGGMNSQGLCMAALTSNSFPDDTLKIKGRSSASIQLYALANCKNIKEFDEYLNSLSQPLAVRFNLGVIDAEGGAAFYEFGNDKWVKYDVNDPKDAPEGWRCCTNFSFSGDEPTQTGVDRYEDCVEIMKAVRKNADGKYEILPEYLMDRCGRSLVNVRAHMNDDTVVSESLVDKGLISYWRTSNLLVFQSVAAGTDPKYGVMWTALGHPRCSPLIPLLPALGNTLPLYIDNPPAKQAEIFALVMGISDKYLYHYGEKGKNRPFDVAAARRLRVCANAAEKAIAELFRSIYEPWESGQMSDEQFKAAYLTQTDEYLNIFKREFAEYL